MDALIKNKKKTKTTNDKLEDNLIDAFTLF